MKLTFLVLLVCVFAFSQTPAPPVPPPATTSILPDSGIFLGVGLGPTSGTATHLVGTGGYLKKISGNTYTFARYDILGLNKKPVSLQTVVTAGICNVMYQYGKVFAGACLDGGTAVSGQNIGGAIGSDGLAGVRLGKSGSRAIVIMGGIMKTALGQAVNPVRAVFVYTF
jgi:hypothetical protein